MVDAVQIIVDNFLAHGGGVFAGAGKHEEVCLGGAVYGAGVGIGDVNRIVAAAFGHIAGGLQHAHDLILRAGQGDGLPQASAAEGLLVDISADDADILLARHVEILQETPLAQHGAESRAHAGKVLADAVDRGAFKFLRPAAHLGLGGDIGGHAGEIIRILLQQFVHVLHIHHAGTAAAAHDLDLDQVRAQLVEFLVHHALHAAAEARDDDDRRHADDDAQHRQQRAHLAGHEGADGQAEILLDIHCAASSSPASEGCTTARGSSAGPS